MGTNQELEKSLEQLDALADDFKQTTEAHDAVAKSEAAKQPDAEEEDKENDNDETGARADDDAASDVEKAAKPDEIAQDEEDKEKEEGENEETKDENNNQEGNTKKLMDKNAKKADKADKSGEEAPEDAEDEKKKHAVDDDEEEEQVTKKSMEELFEPLYKSARPGSNAEHLIDVFHKSMHIQEESNENLEKSLITLTNHMATLMESIAKSNNTLSDRVRQLEKSNRVQQATIKEQHDAIQKSVQEQHDLAKSQPQERKSTASFVEKSFDHSAGLTGEGSSNLSKAEVLEKLTGLATNGDGTVTVNDVMTYESSGEMRPAVEKLVNN